MTNMVRHFVLLLFALAISSVTARANTITLNYDFSASGFGIGAPVDPVTGSFSVTFDADANIINDETSGIVVSNLNISLDSAPSFTYVKAANVLYIGGSAGGTGGFDPGTNDFLMVIGSPASSPTSSLFFYQTSASNHTFVTGESELTPTVPEPATITLLGVGLASLGPRRLRRSKS
jgi:PEP-CTERM motif.